MVENWNATNDFICYGRQGELATNNREQQEIVTLSLQLLQNCLMLVNTILVERTIEQEGLWEHLSAEDRRALTPLFHGHINPYGQFTLDLARLRSWELLDGSSDHPQADGQEAARILRPERPDFAYSRRSFSIPE